MRIGINRVVIVLAGFGVLTESCVQAQAQTPTQNRSVVIQSGTSYHDDVSPALREIAPGWPAARKGDDRTIALSPVIPSNRIDRSDLIIQDGFTASSIPSPILDFDGMRFGAGGSSVPPDTDGAVGMTQYVQVVKQAYQVFDKSTGVSVLGPANISSIWSGAGGVCQNSGTGNPAVLYDHMANRWLISQFAGTSAPTDECVAISTTSDATGTWNRYAFHLGANLFDSPHIGIWPDGYYMSVNVFNSSGTTFLGPQGFAFDRTAMLAGAPATFVTPGITGGASEPSFLPSDLDGVITPPAGTGNPFVSFPGAGTYTVRLFHADFVTPGNTTFDLIGSPAAAGFTPLCPGTVVCVPQPGTAAQLDGLGGRLMVRLAYRKFADHESVVGNYAVSANGVAGIRWFELRNVTDGPVTVYQESTYQPDTTWRWTGSGAMDQAGNFALGFSASSSTVYPSIRYTGRLVGDPLNTLPQGEAALIAGSGSQTGSSGWGRSSSMSIDPMDDCTFWYTNEYYETTSANNWRTRIGNFKFKECTSGPTPTPTPPAPSPTPTSTPTPTPLPCSSPVLGYRPEHFDNVVPPALPPGWTATSAAGATLWTTSNAGDPLPPADTTPNAAFIDDPDAVSDQRLDSPSIDVFGTDTRLTFRHNFNFQDGFDGGVLEISIHDGPFQDVITAGGGFLLGGYNATISAIGGGPIASRQAWSGNSHGFITTIVRLPSNTDFSTFRLRWRMGSDATVSGQGWRVDTVSFMYCPKPIPSTPTPGPTTPPPTPTATATPTPSPTPTANPTPTPTASPSPTATPFPAAVHALNISTRLRVEPGDRVAIGGFIITGIEPKKVAIRGIGPSLGNSGLGDVLADPTLELRDASGVLLLQNDNWQDDPAQAAQLTTLGLGLPDPRESGIVITLDPGACTAILAGKNQTTGVGLIEIYDADPAVASQLANISTRGLVQAGDNVMIGGFILGQGNASAAVAVRGIGPSLSQAGLTDVLPDPTLELHDGNGALLVANDNWQDDAVSAAQLAGHGLAPANSLESGIFATLPPGLFTAILAGKNGGVGLGLVEIYSGLDGNTLTVTSTADSGPGSLRDAIVVVGDGGTIQFDPALNGQTITLTSSELLIDKSITIRGPAIVQRSTADGTPAFRIFHVTPGHTVTMHGLTISNGFANMNNPSGGGVFNDQSTLTLNYCAVEYNHSAVGSGGGIYNSGSSAILTVVHSTVTGNFMEVEPVFICCGGGFGAGICSTGTLAIDHSTVRGNRTGYIQNNFSGDGGGIYVSGGAVTISNSSVSGNFANRVAGGIFNQGTLEITNSTILYNQAIFAGGGIYNGGTLAIDNSTFTGNTTDTLPPQGQGGGIKNTSSATIIRTTFSGNRADGDGGGIFNSGAIQIGNTILKADSTGGGNIFSQGASTVTSLGYNLSSDNGGGFLTATGDQINTNPMLGPLQDNGGPTFTHALLFGSPAIDAGDPNFAPPPSFDQRGPGYPRVIGGRIDIGSFEVQETARTPGTRR